MSNRFNRAVRNPWVLFLIAMIALSATVVQFVDGEVDPSASQSSQNHIVSQNARTLRCVTRWAHAVTARSEFLQQYAIPRDTAQARLDAARDQNAPSSTIKPLLRSFLKSELVYNAALRKTPVPQPPTFSCSANEKTPHIPAPRPPSTSASMPRRLPHSASRHPRTRAATTRHSSAPSAPTATRTPVRSSPTPHPTRPRHRAPSPTPTASPPSGLPSFICSLLDLAISCPSKGTS